MHFLAGGGNGQTPLDTDEAEGLVPSWPATREDLNRAEQENILRAETWARGRTFTFREILTERFIRRLHKRMFGDVWRWAGVYRTSNKNLGVDYWQIPEELGRLLGDVEVQIENTAYQPREVAVRFHHRLVSIHPFPNGNGRLSRMAADLVVVALGGQRLTWGAGLAAEDVSGARRRYIQALQLADNNEFSALIEFAQS